MRAREGDLVRTSDNVIFDVKGLVHPPDKVIAFPRYIPKSEGTRGRKGSMHDKIYSLAERFQYLQQNSPQLIVADPVFGENLCEVPVSAITKHYMPARKLGELRKARKLASLERKAVMLTEILKQSANIPWKSIGVSGSIMARLFTLQSDIDLLVYGIENSRRIYSALENLLKNGKSQIRAYSKEELRTLFDFRSKDTRMSFEDFVKVEGRKAFQGKFGGVDYFIRFVKDWKETSEGYGDICYRNCGYAKITAIVASDIEALFTPCTYKVENVKSIDGPKLGQITEVVSFRGRFCQQARTGERIVVKGKLEHANDTRNYDEHYRIMIGNEPSDYMVLSKT